MFSWRNLPRQTHQISALRVAGIVRPANEWIYTYYSYDANGQVMAVYDVKMSSTLNVATLDEQHIYGASRLGMIKPNLSVSLSNVEATTKSNYVGKTYFEINNYLGNVNAVITDRRTANLTPSSSNPSTWEAVVINTSDYYPYGMIMPNRSNSYGAGIAYRYAYNGMETDGEVSGNGNSYTTEFRQYDPRLGRWKSLDPEFQPWQSPYCGLDNNPILNIDPLGDKIIASKQERKALQKRGDWKEIKAKYGGRKSPDLVVTKVGNDRAETIDKAEITEMNKMGVDNDKGLDHLYYSKIVEEEKIIVTYENRKHGNLVFRNDPIKKEYDAINVGDDFKKGGKSTKEIIESSEKVISAKIELKKGAVRLDDQAFIQPFGGYPSIYTFYLDGEKMKFIDNGISPGSIIGNLKGSRIHEIKEPGELSINNIITAQSIRYSNGGRVDMCHGFVLKLEITIEKEIKSGKTVHRGRSKFFKRSWAHLKNLKMK